MATSAEVLALDALVNETAEAIGVLRGNGDNIWMLICGFLVFWMHAGFTMLEAGSVRHRNAVNIMFKNLGTICIGGIMYWIFGYGFAYGGRNADKGVNVFVGAGNFALVDEEIADGGRALFFFQFAFAATAATIVSGAVAGRIALPAYFGVATWLTAFVYPVVTHWVWNTGGWISAFQEDYSSPENFFNDGCGMIDYAGSGVVHLTGGVAAFWGALILGPRLGRWSGDAKDFAPHNIALQTLGVFILWFGWYGFNCGSTLLWDGTNAGQVAVNTTLSPAACVLTGMLVMKLLSGTWDIGVALNCALAGLVSITAGCSTITEGYTILTGVLGAFVYIGSSKLMKIIGVDDPVDAIAVHGFCGIWGCIAVGLFASQELIGQAYSAEFPCAGGIIEGNGGVQLGTQLVGLGAIIGWVSAASAPLFIILKLTKVLRVSEEAEITGLDSSEHAGAVAFLPGDAKDH